MVATPETLTKRPNICRTCVRQYVAVTEVAYESTQGWSAEDFGRNLTTAISEYDTIAFWCEGVLAPMVIARFMTVDECPSCSS